MRNDTYFLPIFNDCEVERVISKIDPKGNRACNNNILLSSNGHYSGNYYGHSLKRSHLDNCTFSDAQFDHTSFTGSILTNINFESTCKFECVYMEQSILLNIIFGKGINIEGCNFSHSYLQNISVCNATVRSTYFSNCFLKSCNFENSILRSTMFDSAYLIQCSFKNCDMRNLNIEFATVDACDFTDSVISYFQFPYIIGIFKNVKDNFFLSCDEEHMSFTDYLAQIDDSIIYFTHLREYFPLVSLYYAKGEIDLAKTYIHVGIQKAISECDIRMIGHYCRLGQCYDLLTVSESKKIIADTDQMLETQKNSELFNILLSKSYDLKSIIAQNESKSKFEIIINTTLGENEFSKVGELCQNLDQIIREYDDVTTSYQISHNSPFEICVTCVGAVANLVKIIENIRSFVEKNKKEQVVNNNDSKNALSEKVRRHNAMYTEYLEQELDALQENLKNTKYSNYSNVISSFRGKLLSQTAMLQKEAEYIIFSDI